MRSVGFWLGLFAALFLVGVLPAAAQLSAAPPDPLARIREAAGSGAPACSATGESLCEQVAPKIIENALGESPLADNLRRLANETGGHASGAPTAARAVAWGVAAFRDAGVDVHIEKYAGHTGGPPEQENVIAEIRGREKPDEWVLLGAHLDARVPGAGEISDSCNSAMVIEAARDIQRTGIHPRRSIRFVLFAGDQRGMSGSWAYVLAHRAELDSARAVIVFGAGCGPVAGYLLNGRHDIEPGVRDAMKSIEPLGADHFGFGAPLGSDNFDFLIEGLPTLVANREEVKRLPDAQSASKTPGNVDIKELKRDSAIAAVTAFGIAERDAPIGPRQSRSEIESLLRASGLEQQMKTSGLWPLWESGARGRLP